MPANQSSYASAMAPHAAGPVSLAVCVDAAGHADGHPTVRLDADHVRRLWQQGRAKAEAAATAARLCEDPDLLDEIGRRDRRVVVREAVLRNSAARLDTLLAINDTRGSSSTELHDACATYIGARLAVMAPADALEMLLRPLPGDVVRRVLHRSDLTDDELVAFLDGAGDRAGAFASVIADRLDFAKRSSALCVAVAELRPLACTKAVVLRNHPEVLDRVLGHLEASGPKVARSVAAVVAYNALGDDAHRRLAALLPVVNDTDAWRRFCTNRDVDPELFADLPTTPSTAAGLARLLAARIGDDQAAWATAVALAPDWNGTIGELVAAAETLAASA